MAHLMRFSDEIADITKCISHRDSMEALSLNTLFDLVNARYGLATHCLPCNKWHDFDIEELVAKQGNRSILDLKPCCSMCGERAEKQVTPPMRQFEGYPE